MEVTLGLEKFDASVTEEFKEQLDREWVEGVTSVVVDMSRVAFIDSSGVGALLSLRKRLGSEEEPIVLLRPQSMILRVLEMLRLHRVFRMED